MSARQPSRTAGLFDIRYIIGALLGLYGAVLVVTGVVGTSTAEVDKSAGVNANLWAGIAMLLAAAFFGVWAWLRPTVVATEEAEVDDGPVPPGER
jgi:drug/metabolite transporter (DMT)-like permease